MPIGMTSRQIASHRAGRPKPEPSRSQPFGASAGGSRIAAGSSATGASANGPKPNRPANRNAVYSAAADRSPSRPSSTGVTAIGPSSMAPVGSPRHRPNRNAADAGEGRHADGEPQLLPGPRDWMEHVREDRDDHQADHDREEDVVAARLALGHGDRDVAEGGRHEDEGEDQNQPPEGGAGQGQDAEAADRVRRDPFRGEREPEETTDDRHPDREREPVAAAVPRPQPEGREERVGGHDAEPDIRVVHPDPALGEEHPVDEDHDRRDDRRSPGAGTGAARGRTGTAPSARPR